MGHHLTDSGEFKSDKYPWCPEGFFALKVSDSVAQACMLFYAELTSDAELADDLRQVVSHQRREAIENALETKT